MEIFPKSFNEAGNDFTSQSNGAPVSFNHWKYCGWRELAQIPEAGGSFGLLISLLAH